MTAAAYQEAWAEFQSTLPRGERRTEVQVKEAAQVFQSTLPRGERPFMRL